MALIKCHECGGQVSSTAEACPHCGAKPNVASSPSATPSPAPAPSRPGPKPKKTFGCFSSLLVIGLSFWVLAKIIGGSSTNVPPAPVAPPAPPPPIATLSSEFDQQVANKAWAQAQARLALMKKHYPDAPETKGALVQQDTIQKGLADERAKAQAAAEANRKKAQAALEAKRKGALAGMRRDHDDMKKASFYFAPDVPMRGGNYFGLYLVVDDDGPIYPRFKFMYTADDWLFIESLTLNIDGQVLPNATFGHFGVERDNSGGTIFEWHDEQVKDDTLGLFARIAASKKTVVRYNGQHYYKDRTLSEGEKRGIQRVIDAYRALKG